MRQTEGRSLGKRARWLFIAGVSLILLFALPQFSSKAENLEEEGDRKIMAEAGSMKGKQSEGRFEFEKQKIFFKDYSPAGKAKATVLLLHGARFSSATWEETKTLNELQDAGIRAFAVDLPGFAKSKGVKVSDRTAFMEALVKYIGKVGFIVSPSASGSFSLPYLETKGTEIDGFIPVAPVGVSGFKPSGEVKKKLKVFAVVGEKDGGGVRDLEKFETLFKNFDKLIIKDGSHPAYLDAPDLWNKELIAFILKVAKDDR
ncbi:hypothetical protein BSKO_03464 [Bryopsis sp. KO-2023]|nr:hypothetical protein BSKO_03464 [Bryopsis sp. KO-2023]